MTKKPRVQVLASTSAGAIDPGDVVKMVRHREVGEPVFVPFPLDTAGVRTRLSALTISGYNYRRTWMTRSNPSGLFIVRTR